MTQEQRIEILDGKGRFGRLDFERFITSNDLHRINSWYKSRTGEMPSWVQHLSKLSQGPRKNGDLGWWRPCRFQIEACNTKVPQGLRLDPASLGWEAMRALREHKTAILDWIDTGPLKTDWRENKEHHEEIVKLYDFKGKPPSPFEGSAVLDKIEKDGIHIKTEAVDEVLETGCFVIYSSEQDAYLTPQHNWQSLNRALMFTTQNDAERIIKDKRHTNAQVARATLRVESFSFPDKIGEKAREAISSRDAQSLDANTAPTPTRSPSRARL